VTPPAGALAITLAGEALWLLPQRAAYWPREGALLVADAHFGKAAAFRARGVAVPEGTTAETLERLDAALAATGAGTVCFLGDLLHSARGRAPATLDAVARWRRRHSRLELVLVRGNHDRHAGDPPPQWGVRCVAEPWRLGPLALCHDPQTGGAGYTLAGHVHPAIRLAGRGGERLRLPCFLVRPRGAVLPAFGSFTGGRDVRPGPGETAYAVAGGAVIPAAGECAVV
jgi:DNA ligase-associated metallophosphoesterase